MQGRALWDWWCISGAGRERDDLWQLLALCHRYRIIMRQLAKFETAKNRSWFCGPKMFWHKAVFG